MLSCRLQLIDIALMQKNWAEALKLASGPENDVLLIWIALIQQNWQGALKLAVKAAGERAFLSAEFYVIQGCERAFFTTEGYVLQGYAYDQMRDSPQALDCLQKAVALKPFEPYAIKNLAILYLNQGHPKQAAPLFQKCLKLVSQDFQAKLLLEQAEKQIQIFAEIYKIPLSKEFLDKTGAPKYQYVFNRKAEDIANRANLYAIQLIQSGLLLDAAHWLLRFIELYDRSPTLYYNLGQVYNTQKIWYQAAQYAWRAIDLKKNYRDAYDLLGSVLFKIGDLESSVRFYQEAVALDPNDAMGYYNLGCSYNAMSVLDKAEKNWLLAIKQDKVEPSTEEKAARSDDIKVVLSVRAEPVSCLALFSLASLYLRQDKREAALSAFQTASGLAPNKPDPYLEIGKIFLSMNKTEQAQKNFDKYLALGGN